MADAPPEARRGRLLDRAVTLLLALGGVGAGVALWPWPWLRWPVPDPGWSTLLPPVGGYVLARLLARLLPMALVLEHELAHALTAGLLMGRVLEIRVAARSGHAVHTASGLRATAVRLAPYVLPLLPLAVLPFRHVVRPELLPAWQAAYLGAWGFELGRVRGDIHRAQPDLLRGGLLVSLLAVGAWNALLWSWLLLLPA